MILNRRRWACGLLCFLAAGSATAQSAVSELTRRQDLEIAASTAPQALREFVRQTGLQVLFEFDAVRHHTTHAVRGRLDPSEAIALMLSGTGLAFEFVNERTISVRPVPLPKDAEVAGR
jgi:iron complex outermembrane recepter protein